MSIHQRASGRFTAKCKLPNGSTLNVGTYHSREAAEAACDAEYERIRNGESEAAKGDTISKKEYAARIGVPAGTVGRWISEGMPVVRAGMSVRIDASVTDAWVKEYHGKSVSFGRQGTLYVVQRDSDDAIKIGWTSDVVRRVVELRKKGGAAIVLLAVIPGDKPDELRLHARFADDRLDGEWFRHSRAIADFIAALREVAA